MLADISSTKDLEVRFEAAYKKRISNLEELISKINQFDPSLNKPDIDKIFERASRLRDRRLDFAIYQLAMKAKGGTDTEQLLAAKKKVMGELQRVLTQNKHNTQIQAFITRKS